MCACWPDQEVRIQDFLIGVQICDACGIATFVTAYRDASSQNTMNMNKG